MSELTRRSALRGGGVALAGAAIGFGVTRGTVDSGDRGNDQANAYGAEPASGGTAAIAAVTDVPVGGGLIRGNLVLTRPSGNDVRAFSAICTHQGCKVDRITDGHIESPCHGSVFDAATGAVVHGPASTALGKIAVVVRNGEVYRS
jgi:Rieske Fe-S protein